LGAFLDRARRLIHGCQMNDDPTAKYALPKQRIGPYRTAHVMWI
jgi:hypothetical protein